MKFIKNHISETAIAVVIFLGLFLWAMSDAEGSEVTPKIGLGQTVINSSQTTGEFGVEYNNWELSAGIIGSGNTKKGEQDTVGLVSISRLVRPSWTFLGGKNYYRMGIAYIDDSPLVGSFNYRLGIGLEYKFVSVEYFHYSSAGIYKTNTGIDGLMIKFHF